MAKYSIGFFKRRTDSDSYFSRCNCGTTKLLGSLGWRELDRLNVKCDGCGNTNFVNLSSNSRIIHPYIEVLEKSRKGFKVKRTNLSVFYDDDFNVMTKANMIQVLVYDLVNGEIKLYKNGSPVEINRFYPERTIGRFFTNVDDRKFKSLVSTIETESLYDFAFESLSYKNGRSYGDRKIWRGLRELLNGYTHMQILANAGFPNISRFYERPSRWNNNTFNRDGKNPREILGVPKFVLKYIRENQNVGAFEIKQIKNALTKVDGNRFRELMEIVKDESTIRDLCNCLDTLIEIHDKYDYNNIKKLTLYLFREIRMNQGIDSPSSGATLLRDYIRMATKLGQEYEKYPKSLKKEHDITQMNYRVQESEIKKKEFAQAIESEYYKSLEYKKRDFSIITPSEMQDLIREGSELSHCVASYVDSIVSNRCQILFLRDTEDIDTPLATVEVRGHNVRQARGYANRALRQSERDFISEWAKKKELELNYYY